MEVNAVVNRISQAAALARYSNNENREKIEALKNEPAVETHISAEYRQQAAQPEQTARYQPKIEDESYQEMLREARQRKEQRKQETVALATQYSKSLGHDSQDGGPGQQWFEKTVALYSSSPEMVDRLRQLVEMATKI